MKFTKIGPEMIKILSGEEDHSLSLLSIHVPFKSWDLYSLFLQLERKEREASLIKQKLQQEHILSPRNMKSIKIGQ